MGTDFSRSAAISARTRFCALVGLNGRIRFKASRTLSSTHVKGDGVFLAHGLASQGQAQLVEEKLLENQALLRGRAKEVERFERLVCRGKMRVDQGIATRGIAQPVAQRGRQERREYSGSRFVQRGINGAADHARAKGADGFIDGHDAAHLGGIDFAGAQHFDLRIHHFSARGAQLIDFHFAVENYFLAGLQPPFQVATMKEFAGQRARIILNQEVINGIAAAHAPHCLAAHYARTQRINAVRLNVLDLGKNECDLRSGRADS